MSDLKNTLKEFLPQSQRNSDSLNEFMDAVGELLDGFNTTVDDFKHYPDSKLIDETKLDNLAGQFDFSYPRNLSTTRKRELIQEAVALYRTNGTERSLKRVFRLIGWSVDIDYCWTLNPDVSSDVQYLYNGTITYDGSLGYTYNEHPVVSPVGIYSIIFGNEVIYSNGVFADLYDAGGGTYPKNTILGEEYGEYGETDLLVVAKAPYIRINVNEEDYALFTQDYVDPETGKVYSYTSTEQYDITQELITYFLEQVRPANVSILEIVTPFALSDTFAEFLNDDDLTFTHSGLIPEYDGTLAYGTDIDRYALGESFGGFEYGTDALVFNDPPAPQVITRSYPIGTPTGHVDYTPTWDVTQIDLTVPADAVVSLYTTKSDRFELVADTQVWTPYANYTNVTNEIINISGSFAVTLNVITPSSTGSIDMQLTLSH